MRQHLRTPLALLASTLLLVFVASCGDEDGPTNPDTDPPDDEVVVTERAAVVDTARTAAVIDRVEPGLDGDVIVTRDFAEAEGLEEGSALVAGVSPKTPAGLLRRVTAVEDEGGNVRLVTEQGVLTDVIEQCDIDERLEFTPQSVDSVTTIEGVTQVFPKTGLESEFDFEVDVIVYDAGDDRTTTRDQVKVTGELGFAAGLDFEVDVDFVGFWQKPRLTHLVMEMDRTTELELSAQYGAAARIDAYEKKISTIHVGTVTIMAGPVPIVLVLDIDVGFKVSVTGSVSVELGYHFRDVSRTGYLYETDEDGENGVWSEIEDSSEEERISEPLDIEVAGSATAKAGFYAKKNIQLYGVVGPYVRNDLYAQLEAEASAGTDGASIELTADAGLSAALGLALDVLGHPVADVKADWTLLEFEFYQVTIPLAGTGTIVVDPEPNALGAEWVLTGDLILDETYRLEGSGDRTVEDLQTGTYTLEWADVAGWVTPAPQTAVLATDEIVTFQGVYTEDLPGTLVLDVTPDTIDAPWSVVGPSSYSTSGTGDTTLEDLEPGSYTATWQAVDGWNVPAPATETVDVPGGGTATVTGTYTEIPDEPPVACMRVSPSTGSIDTEFEFDASCSLDPSGPAGDLEYRWDWEADGTYDYPANGAYTTDPVATNTFDTAGSKNVRVQVRDSTGNTDSVIESFEVTDTPSAPANFVTIPAGTFEMGSPPDEPGRGGDETQHTVTLTTAFAMQTTEVTNAQYAELAQWAVDNGHATVTSSSLRDALDGSTRELLDLNDSDCEISYTGGQFVVDAGKENHPVVEGELVRCGGLLRLVEPTRGPAAGLRPFHVDGARIDSVRGTGLPSADRGGVGACVPGGDGDRVQQRDELPVRGHRGELRRRPAAFGLSSRHRSRWNDRGCQSTGG